jgi:hypothetical protein
VSADWQRVLRLTRPEAASGEILNGVVPPKIGPNGMWRAQWLALVSATKKAAGRGADKGE